MTSKPIAFASSTRGKQSRKVDPRSPRPSAERGKNSYHAPICALGRSTITRGGGAKCVGPRLDRVFVNGAIVKSTNATPAVVIDESHRRFTPVSLPEGAPLQDGRNDVMPVLKDVRFDYEIFADEALYWIAPAINQRLQVLDDGGRKG